MVVGMDRGGPPVGDLVGLAVPGSEERELLLPEDLERPAAGRAVDALSRHLQAPAAGGGAQVDDVPEVAALEEALAHVGDAALDARLVAGMTHARGVGDEAAVAGVLEEAPREARVQRVGPGDGGREVIDDEVARHAPRRRPRPPPGPRSQRPASGWWWATQSSGGSSARRRPAPTPRAGGRSRGPG